MEAVECVRFAVSQKFKLENFTCMDVQFSGINEGTIREKIQSKDAAFFTEEYLLFLASPEEAGTCFGGQNLENEKIDLDLLKQLNSVMSGLDASVKEVMVSKMDNYMVDFLLFSSIRFRMLKMPLLVSLLQRRREI